ncbi:MAG: cyclic nucleotide-binding domain-containing protein [Gammaproteobacteria bacterium]|nr:cyclic nucleotide-binding domain-containing protein [Gammaproteobacteria bacterium]
MTTKQIDISQLKGLSPLGGLKQENLHGLMEKSRVKTVSAGASLFEVGDDEKLTIYLLAGDVELVNSQGKVVKTVSAGSDDARHPLAPILPRKLAARASTDVDYISFDSDLLDVMLTWDQTGSYEVGELRAEQVVDEEDDWMTTLLQTKAFHKIPPANIQAIFMRMQRVNYKAGDTVIKQGDVGDYFYVITAGRCAVTRETPLNKEGIKLAELRVGDSFGEEALISEANRNATVTMLTDGTLMRLGKEDFNTLLNEPMLQWVDLKQAEKLVADGGKWLDVRLPSEFENVNIKGALNIPLYFIRLKLRSLDPDLKYVVVCDTGRRSSAAAYVLNERGIDSYVLKGGLTTSGALKE